MPFLDEIQDAQIQKFKLSKAGYFDQINDFIVDLTLLE